MHANDDVLLYFVLKYQRFIENIICVNYSSLEIFYVFMKIKITKI